MQKKEKEFIYDMIVDKDYIQTGQYEKSFGIQFGGDRGSGDGRL